jgi:hypothetical protein
MSRKTKAVMRKALGNGYGVREAAEYLKVSQSYLNSMRHYDSGPAYSKPGKLIVYEKADLDAWATAALSKKRATARLNKRTRAKKLSTMADKMQARVDKLRAEEAQLGAQLRAA